MIPIDRQYLVMMRTLSTVIGLLGYEHTRSSEGGMGWSLRRGDSLCSHAFSSQLSWRREYKIPIYNKPSKRDGKDKEKGAGG